jgi:HK97 family phage major capsid protein
MEKLVELREKRAKAWEATKAFLESKRNDSGIVSAEDTTTYEKMEAEVMALTGEIERLERQAEMDSKFSNITDRPILNNPGAAHHMNAVNGNSRTQATAAHATGLASDTYSQAFWNAMRENRVVSNDLAIGTDAQGGYLVPDEFHRQLIQALEEYNIMRRLARVIRTSSGDLQIPVVATRGTAAWVDEAGTIPTSDTNFGQVTLSAYKLATMIKVSNELLNDSAFPLDSFLAQDFGRRMGTLEEEAFIGGNGTKKPTGFLVDAQVGTTATSPTAVTFDNVMDLFHSLKSPYRNRAVFIANDLTIKALRKLKDSNGQYLWQPSVVAGTPDTVLGRPIHVSSYMPELAADEKAMAFGDFSFYWIADRQGRTFERLNELFAATDQVGFKATQRVDGKLILPEAVKVMQMGAGS